MKSSKAQQSKEKGLPPIPDYPLSPLPAWKHYGILKLAEQKIHDNLAQVDYSGRLIGIRIGYSSGKESAFDMSYGYDVEEELPESAGGPLSDEFALELYKFVNGLIAENTDPETKYQTSLEACVNRRARRVRVESRICAAGECANNPSTCVGNLRVMIKRNKKPWVCQHIDPNDLSN